MKILFYNHTGQVSGAERVMLMILARLDRKKFDSVVVCPAEGTLRELAAEVGVRVETVMSLNARYTWRPNVLVQYLRSFYQVLKDLRRMVIRVNPDLIHANSIRAGLVATAATIDLATPVVWHLHDILPRHPISSSIRLFAALNRRTRMIAVSQAVARNFYGRLSRFLKSRVCVILNSLELDKFSVALDRESTRESLGLGNAQPVIGTVGQLTPRKGQLELIRAFAKARKELPDAVLLIVGAAIFNRDHEYAANLEQESRELGISDNVRFLGSRKDVAELMRAMDLLVVNSAVEPFGLVALEAMACGTPVLATAVGGMPEMIEHSKTGWLVRAGDETTLTRAMVELWQQPDLRQRMIEAGKLNVKARFSAERYLDELENFYTANWPVPPANQARKSHAAFAPSAASLKS